MGLDETGWGGAKQGSEMVWRMIWQLASSGWAARADGLQASADCRALNVVDADGVVRNETVVGVYLYHLCDDLLALTDVGKGQTEMG